ncbi:MAG: chemotaxis protein CheD [Pseudomonadota bacterium]
MSQAASVDTPIIVAQGEYHVASGPGVVLTTILGSCVAACLWDEATGIGGMNHIVLPDATDHDMMRASVGVNAMELLINGIIREGGERSRLRAKLFGGARMIAGLSNVGARNGAFAQDFLEAEGIPCVSASLGGVCGRRVQFWPATGRARQKLLQDAMPDEAAALQAPPPAPATDTVELF